jgi:hypothetical protein
MTFTSPNPNVTVSTTSGMVLGTYNTGSLAVTLQVLGSNLDLFYKELIPK